MNSKRLLLILIVLGLCAGCGDYIYNNRNVQFYLDSFNSFINSKSRMGLTFGVTIFAIIAYTLKRLNDSKEKGDNNPIITSIESLISVMTTVVILESGYRLIYGTLTQMFTDHVYINVSTDNQWFHVISVLAAGIAITIFCFHRMYNIITAGVKFLWKT